MRVAISKDLVLNFWFIWTPYKRMTDRRTVTDGRWEVKVKNNLYLNYHTAYCPFIARYFLNCHALNWVLCCELRAYVWFTQWCI